jgi:hypothetical protein
MELTTRAISAVLMSWGGDCGIFFSPLACWAGAEAFVKLASPTAGAGADDLAISGGGAPQLVKIILPSRVVRNTLGLRTEGVEWFIRVLAKVNFY